MSALREVLAVFDIVVNDTALDAGNRKLDTFVDKLKGIGAALASFGIVKSVISFGEHVAEAAREVEFHAARMEMNVDEYQRLSQVAGNYGMTMENLQIANTLFVRSLSNVGGVLGDFHGNAKHAHDAMKNLGLDPGQFRGKRLIEILPTIADAFQKIEDPLKRVTIGLNLFGHRGRSIMPMMAQSGEELRRQFAAAVPVFEEATIHSADRATIAGKQLARTWENLVNNSFGRAVLDTFTVVARKLTDIVLAVKDLAKYSEIGKGVLTALGVALAAAAVLAIAAWWPVLLPILAVTAAFAALALAVDDFIVFMKGGDSILGDFFDELLGPGGAEKAQKVIKEMWEDFKGFLEQLKDKGWAEFLEGTKAIIRDIRSGIAEIKNIIEWIEIHWTKLREGFDQIAHFFGGGSHDIKATTTVAQALTSGSFQPSNIAPPPEIGPPTAAQAAAFPSGGGVPTVNIHGGVDSEELARKVKRTVTDHYEEVNGLLFRDTMAAARGSK